MLKFFYKKRVLNILIADDDQEVAKLLKQILELRGHNVTIVEDGSRCITLCHLNKFDLIFIDYHMQGLNGTDVINIVRNNGQFPGTNTLAIREEGTSMKNTLIFAYTGDNSKNALHEFKICGMNGAIVKPIDMKSINILLKNIETRVELDSEIIKKQINSKDLILFDILSPVIKV